MEAVRKGNVFFTERLTKCWTRFPREFVEAPSLEISKSCLVMVLGNWLWVALLKHWAWTG